MDILLLEWFVAFLWHILVQKCPTHFCLWSVYNSVDTWTVALFHVITLVFSAVEAATAKARVVHRLVGCYTLATVNG